MLGKSSITHGVGFSFSFKKIFFSLKAGSLCVALVWPGTSYVDQAGL